MHEDNLLSSTKRIGTGLAFVIFPTVFVFAFSVHPGLLHPHLLGPSELILRARSAGLFQLGRALVTLDTALLVVVALQFMKLLNHGPVHGQDSLAEHSRYWALWRWQRTRARYASP